MGSGCEITGRDIRELAEKNAKDKEESEKKVERMTFLEKLVKNLAINNYCGRSR